MNRGLILPLLICGLVLAGCYRQAEDSFEQVDSQSVQAIASPTDNTFGLTPTNSTTDLNPESTEDIDSASTAGTPGVLPSKTTDPNFAEPTDIVLSTPTLGIPTGDESPIVPTATDPVFLTPEPPPAQVEQPTVNPPTPTATFDIVPPTPTDIADALEAGDECIHEIVGGDTLFRIAINNGTTVEAIQQLNSLDGDAIQVGQLIQIPGCVPGQADDSDDDSTDTVAQPTPTSLVGGSTVATVEPADNIPTAGQQIHVVVSGETLGGIANRYNTSISAIVELNELSNPDALAVGDELLIPASG